jgi:hypothetical protein
MLSKGKRKIQLSGDQVQPARFSGPNKIDCLYQAKYVTQAITAYIAITINAIFTVSPTCNELNSFIQKNFRVNQLGDWTTVFQGRNLNELYVTLRRFWVQIGLSGLWSASRLD